MKNVGMLENWAGDSDFDLALQTRNIFNLANKKSTKIN